MVLFFRAPATEAVLVASDALLSQFRQEDARHKTHRSRQVENKSKNKVKNPKAYGQKATGNKSGDTGGPGNRLGSTGDTGVA